MDDITYVETGRGLAAAVEAIRQAPVIGFDTEFVGEATYQPQLCLLQVATDQGLWLIDPLRGMDLSDFWAALTAPGREVVALAARQEVRFCLRYAQRPPAILFDPQLAAGLVGFSYPLSHTHLVQHVLGVQVEGGETLTDWRRRPLTRRQLEYAADDVRYLLAVRERLLARAQARKRVDWLRHEGEQMVERIVQSEGEERWQRVTGAGGLRRRGLAVLRELWRWREGAARRADLPPRRILGDDLLVEVAKRSPATAADLFALRGFDRPALRQAGPELVAAVRRGLDLPEGALPLPLKHDDPPQLSIVSQLVSIVAASLAVHHEVAPALLATSSDVQDLVRWYLAGGEDEQPQLLQGWRGEIVGRALVDLLTGRNGVRVVDVSAPHPLRVEPM
ncbi:MAG: ribonuclease D [Chloroflexi bacterium]|nr:ribonuclease D [Chloroflexota bacterium]